MGYQDADEAPGLVKEAQALLLGLSTRTVGGGLTSLQGRLLDRLAELRDLRDQLRRDERTVPGVSTGFRDLDRVTGGYQDGDLIIFAALTGAGKTSLGADALYAASFNGVKSLIFSAEMTRRQLEDRALATHARLDLRRLRGAQFDDGEESRLFDAIGRLGSGADILIDDTRDLPVWELCNRARYEAHKERIGLVVVDYLQLLEGERRRGDLRSAEVGSISRALKGLAGELGAPVIALSQLNRQVYNREDKTPLLSDLYESGRIAQDADMVIFIHQPSFFDEDADPNVAQLYVEKNRHGPTCMIPVRWTPEYTTFEDRTAA
jgi:replicative DNA helicase